MKSFKMFLSPLLLLAAFALAGCSLFATPAPPAAPVVISTSTSVPTATSTVAPLPTSTPVTGPQGTLIPTEGRVELRHAYESDFASLRPGQAVLVNAGDVIRTGGDGTASLLLPDNSETLLFPNTVLTLDSLSLTADGSAFIRLVQLIGVTFNSVNFGHAASRQEHLTPYGVAHIESTAYWVEVSFGGTQATMLLTGRLQDFEVQLGMTFDSNNPEPFFRALLGLLSSITGDLSLDVGGGQVSFTDNLGNTVTVTAGFSATSGTDANGNFIRVTVTAIDRFCGDGVCDPYLGETRNTCSADCR